MIKVNQHALINQMYQKNNNNNLQPVCRWPLGRYFKKNNYLTNKKKCSKRFFFIKKNIYTYYHFAITYKTEQF